ncbi:hypothetical protein CSKR_113837 [Clonorchis sinensis]|uniref:Uncharacterized protein n=1 Tax=Clonorchis sinensis TaxID=79923 RepID=A0A419PRY1_CLOSI|nr:hypothetical protein CSKR_113837 [Clonorchis sinensis]
MARRLRVGLTSRKVGGSKLTSAFRPLLDVVDQPKIISDFVLPLGGTEAGHRKDITNERFIPVGRTFVLSQYIFSAKHTTHIIESDSDIIFKQLITSYAPESLYKRKKNRSAVTPFRCLAAMLPEGSTMAEILSGCPSLDRGSREAEVGFEPRTLRSSADLLTGRSVVRTRPQPFDFPHPGLGNLAVSQPPCLLLVAWQQATERVIQLDDNLTSSAYPVAVPGFELRTSDMQGERVTTTPPKHIKKDTSSTGAAFTYWVKQERRKNAKLWKRETVFVSVATIFDISPYMYIRNGLLIRLLKTVRQPTTGFALLGAHQVGAVPEFPSTACSTSTQIGLFFENYTHLQINLVFARDSPETQLNLSFVMISGN